MYVCVFAGLPMRGDVEHGCRVPRPRTHLHIERTCMREQRAQLHKVEQMKEHDRYLTYTVEHWCGADSGRGDWCACVEVSLGAVVGELVGVCVLCIHVCLPLCIPLHTCTHTLSNTTKDAVVAKDCDLTSP